MHEPISSPVHAWNEWDPLEEVIVGRLESAVIPGKHVTVTYNVPATVAKLYPLWGGRRYPRILTEVGKQELESFVHVLEAEGVRGGWEVQGGLSSSENPGSRP